MNEKKYDIIEKIEEWYNICDDITTCIELQKAIDIIKQIEG